MEAERFSFVSHSVTENLVTSLRDVRILEVINAVEMSRVTKFGAKKLS